MQTVTITTASKRLNVPRSTLRHRLKRRGVQTYKFGNYTVLDLEAAKAAMKPQEQPLHFEPFQF